MTLLDYSFKFPGSSRGDFLTLWFLGDLQLGNRLVDKKLFRQHVKMIADDPYARVIFGGDNLDGIVLGDKRFDARILDKDIFDITAADNLLTVANAYLEREIAPIKDKIICWMDGNHEAAANRRAQRNLSEEFCKSLGLVYAGYETVVRLNIRGPHHGREYFVRCHHGSGGGATKSGKMSRMLNKANDWEGIDVHFVGHLHDPMEVPMDRFAPVHSKEGVTIQLHTVYLIRCGSYLKRSAIQRAGVPGTDGYEPVVTAYSEVAEYSPVHLGMRGVQLYVRERKIVPVAP